MSTKTQDSADSSSSIQSTLLRRVREHDAVAWQRLVDLFGPLVYQWSRSSGLQAADAADVVQDVFRTVAMKIHKFQRERPEDSFRGWLFIVTQNKVRDHLRVRARNPDAVGGTGMMHHLQFLQDREEADSVHSSLDESFASPFREALEMIRNRFDEKTWRAFWRVCVEGDRTADVAADLGMTANAVRKSKARVLRRLRDEFGELLD